MHVNTSAKHNIILVGMPGAGKSSVGERVAASLGWRYVDVDREIERIYAGELQSLLERLGVNGFKVAEEKVLLEMDLRGPCVVSTGGSAVYSALGMARLKSSGRLVYLRCGLPTILARVNNWERRGFVSDGSGLEAIWAERAPLYESLADTTIDVDNLGISDVVDLVVQSENLPK